MDVLQWSRHYRCFPGQGALDVAALVDARARRRLRGPALARGLQRRLPPGRPGAHGDRRDALADRARGPAAGARARSTGSRSWRSASTRLGPGHRGAAARDGLRPRRPAPQQAGAAVGARRDPRRAQPRRRRRRPGGRGDRRLQPRPGRQRGPRRGAARPAGRAPPRRRRGRPDGGRGARRHRGLLLRHGLARRLPADRRVRRRAACRSSASTTSRSRSRSRPSTRPGCSTAPCSTCSRARARSWPRRTGSCAAARSRPRRPRARRAQRARARRHARQQASCSTSRSRAPTRSPPRARCASAACRCCTCPTTTTTTWPRGSSSSPRCSRRCASSACSTTARADGELLHFYTARIGGRVFFEVLERRGGYGGYGAVELTRPDGASARSHPRQLGGESMQQLSEPETPPSRALRPRTGRGARAAGARRRCGG